MLVSKRQGPPGPPGGGGDSLWQSTGGTTQLVTPEPVLVNTAAVNASAILTLQNAAGNASIFRVDATPEGAVTGSVGDIADDTTTGVVYVKTAGSATNTGWSPLATLGTKVFMVVEGGQYATIQAAIDATPTGTNSVPAYSVILVGPKANTGGGASGTWGPAVLAANKSLMIAGLGGSQTSKSIRIDSLTLNSSAAGLNANLNENYVSGLYITSSSASSIVTLSGTGAIRLRLNACYVVNSGAGDAVTNSNTSASASLYLDTCIVSAESATGIALKHSGTYTAVRNRSDISTSAGGTSANAGRSLTASAGVVEVYDSTVGGPSVPRPAVELTGTAYVSAGYTTIANASNDAAARCVFVNSTTAVFAAGDASLALGSSVAVAGQVVSGTGTFAYGNITFSYSPLLTVSTQTPALRTGGWFTTAIQEGVSSTSPGSPLFNLNASGRITRYSDAAPTNGQLLIGDTSAGYFKAATLTAGTNVTITNGPGSVTISSTGSTSPYSVDVWDYDWTASSGTTMEADGWTKTGTLTDTATSIGSYTARNLAPSANSGPAYMSKVISGSAPVTGLSIYGGFELRVLCVLPVSASANIVHAPAFCMQAGANQFIIANTATALWASGGTGTLTSLVVVGGLPNRSLWLTVRCANGIYTGTSTATCYTEIWAGPVCLWTGVSSTPWATFTAGNEGLFRIGRIVSPLSGGNVDATKVASIRWRAGWNEAPVNYTMRALNGSVGP